jgi:hypothetical protein
MRAPDKHSRGPSAEYYQTRRSILNAGFGHDSRDDNGNFDAASAWDAVLVSIVGELTYPNVAARGADESQRWSH